MYQISTFNYYYESGFKPIDSLNEKRFALIQLRRGDEFWDKKLAFVQTFDTTYIFINFKIIDTLSVNLKISNNEYLDLAWGGMCYINNKLEYNIIALLSVKPPNIKVLKAWKADIVKRKIIKIDADNLRCICNQ